MFINTWSTYTTVPTCVTIIIHANKYARKISHMHIAIYFLLCLIIGLSGMNRKFGFWGYFFGSILLTPLIGILLVLASDPRKSKADPE